MATTVDEKYKGDYRPYIVNGYARTCKASYTPSSNSETKVKGDVVAVKIGGTSATNRKAVLLQDFTATATDPVDVEVLFSGDVAKSVYSSIDDTDIKKLAENGILVREDK